jgi:hypothetical protein
MKRKNGEKQKSLTGWGTKASQRPHAVPSGNKSFNVDIISRHPTASPSQRHIYILFLLYSGLLLLYLGGTGHIQLTHAWFITRLKCALFIIPIRRRRVCVCNIEIELGRGWMKKKVCQIKPVRINLGCRLKYGGTYYYKTPKCRENQPPSFIPPSTHTYNMALKLRYYEK